MPLVQAARDTGEWLKTAMVLSLSMALVTGIFGALIGAVGGALAATVDGPRVLGNAMGVVLPIIGLVMLIIALGELGLIPRLLPDLPHSLSSTIQTRIPRVGRYGEVAVIGVAIAATFGIVCTQPPYLAVIAFAATSGSVVYGSLVLGAYGVGMALSIALTALGLRQANRSPRLAAWLATRQEALHVLQGVTFAFFGAVPIWFFWARSALDVLVTALQQ